MINKRLLLVARLYTILGILGILLSVTFGVATWLGHVRGNEPEDIKIILDVISVVGVFSSILFFSIILFTGRAVRNKRHYAFCIIVSVLLCFCIPFGAIVGAYSLHVLTKENWNENNS